MATALKSRNRIYRGLLLFEAWMDALPNGYRWALRLAPLILIRVLAAQGNNPVATTLGAIVLIFVAATWASEPVSNLILMTNRTDRQFLSREHRRAAVAFAVLAACAIASFIGASTGTGTLIPYGFGFALWALVIGSIYPVQRTRTSRILVGIVVLAATAGAVGIVLLVAGQKVPAEVLSAVLMLSVVPAAWTARLVR